MTGGHNQSQFLQVIDPELAHSRWRAALGPVSPRTEIVELANLRGRVLARSVAAPGDVPGFDRSNVDGYAVCARDTYGASEGQPVRLRLAGEVIATGVAPQTEVVPGLAVTIATGGMVPRGADAVLMLEDCDLETRDTLIVRRPAVPGAMISFAGSDITRGEVVLRRGSLLSSRETGVLAAIGLGQTLVYRRPRVGVLSTGDELVAPGKPLPLAHVHDCNQTVLADACEELGCEVVRLGIAPDRDAALANTLQAAIASCDLVLLSGGTSKGAGDRSYRAVAELPGPTADIGPIIVHGVALKPGKPVCLAATRTAERIVPIVVLPGFPTSALFTFHEFCAPLLRQLGGRPRKNSAQTSISADLAAGVSSVRGRRQYMLVQLMQPTSGERPVAQAISKGSGSISAFCRADGFVAVPQQQERIEASEAVEVVPMGAATHPADLVIAGSHCTGLELIAEYLHAQGLRIQLVALGSQGGLRNAASELCDVAPIHLYDRQTCTYNRTFVPDNCRLIRGYQRMQGLLFRRDDPRFSAPMGEPTGWVTDNLLADDVVMVNRNRGSGTRVLVDELLAPLAPKRPRGYHHEARSHSGVATCVAQGRADWGIAIATVAEQAGLGFVPIRSESYDFVIPQARFSRAAVQQFLQALTAPEVVEGLTQAGFTPDKGVLS